MIGGFDDAVAVALAVVFVSIQKPAMYRSYKRVRAIRCIP